MAEKIIEHGNKPLIHLTQNEVKRWLRPGQVTFESIYKRVGRVSYIADPSLSRPLAIDKIKHKTARRQVLVTYKRLGTIHEIRVIKMNNHTL